MPIAVVNFRFNPIFLASKRFSLNRCTSFRCPLNANTVRMALNTSSATPPAFPYASSLSTIDDVSTLFTRIVAMITTCHEVKYRNPQIYRFHLFSYQALKPFLPVVRPTWPASFATHEWTRWRLTKWKRINWTPAFRSSLRCLPGVCSNPCSNSHSNRQSPLIQSVNS